MFLALRDVRQAKGRFALIGSVVALITLLVVMLAGLAAGLGRESVSAISSLPSRGVSQVAFSKPSMGQKVGFDSSRTDLVDMKKAASASGVTEAVNLSIGLARAHVNGRSVAVNAFSMARTGFAMPTGVRPGNVVVGSGLAKEAHVSVGDVITLGQAQLRVARLSENASYQHTPVVWMTDSDARAAAVQAANSVVLLKTGPDFSRAKLATAGLQTMSPTAALGTISSYKAENGSLTLMRGMLMVVSALVVGAFFTVWTIQRSPDLAVLKAIGARTSYLMRDALCEAGIILAAGGALGTVAGVLGAVLVRNSVPFVLSPATTLVPVLFLVLLGLIGAVVSVRRIATVDPNTALGAAR